MLEKFSVREIKIEPRADINLSSRQLTLAKVLQCVELTDIERRAMVAADALRNSFAIRRTLFAAFVFFSTPSGIFRVNEVLGFTPDETVAARDLVRTQPGYATLWQRHQTLMEPHVAEVAIYKRGKRTHAQIAKILQVDKDEVDKISLQLTALGIIRRHTWQTDRFERFCRTVEIADTQPKNAQLSAKKLAVLLTSDMADEERVSRARVRNRHQVKAAPPGKAGETAESLRIRTAILANPDKSAAEVAAELVVDKIQVVWQRKQLLAEKVIQRQRLLRSSDNNQGIPSRREEAKQDLRAIIDKVMADRNPVVLAHLRRDNACLQRVSIATLQTVNKELIREREASHLIEQDGINQDSGGEEFLPPEPKGE